MSRRLTSVSTTRAPSSTPRLSTWRHRWYYSALACAALTAGCAIPRPADPSIPRGDTTTAGTAAPRPVAVAPATTPPTDRYAAYSAMIATTADSAWWYFATLHGGGVHAVVDTALKNRVLTFLERTPPADLARTHEAIAAALRTLYREKAESDSLSALLRCRTPAQAMCLPSGTSRDGAEGRVGQLFFDKEASANAYSDQRATLYTLLRAHGVELPDPPRYR